jgi:hypothetical protein
VLFLAQNTIAILLNTTECQKLFNLPHFSAVAQPGCGIAGCGLEVVSAVELQDGRAKVRGEVERYRAAASLIRSDLGPV